MKKQPMCPPTTTELAKRIDALETIVSELQKSLEGVLKDSVVQVSNSLNTCKEEIIKLRLQVVQEKRDRYLRLKKARNLFKSE